MALTYDSAECVLELQTKEAVRTAVVAGWRRVGNACLPQPSPHTPGAPAPSTPSYMLPTFPPQPPLHLHSTATSSNQPPTPNLTTNTNKTTDVEEQWVIHLKTQVLHRWAPTYRFTVCRDWVCGNPIAPKRHAQFVSSRGLNPEHFLTCEGCGF